MWSGIIAAIIVAIYFYLIFPADGKKAEAFKEKYIAHRGFHGNGIIENTMPAFALAVEKGYGIELDIRLSSDKIPVVSHDNSLKRVFGIEKKVSELSAEELEKIGVPRLCDVLELMGGKVPLVAEIKGENKNTEVCEKTAELLDSYNGLYCMESFNPIYVGWFRKNRPNVIRGQLATRFRVRSGKGINFTNLLLTNLLANVISRPHFISYEHNYGRSLSLTLCKWLGAAPVCWTVRSAEELEASRKYFSTYIFENFEP